MLASVGRPGRERRGRELSAGRNGSSGCHSRGSDPGLGVPVCAVHLLRLPEPRGVFGYQQSRGAIVLQPCRRLRLKFSKNHFKTSYFRKKKKKRKQGRTL